MAWVLKAKKCFLPVEEILTALTYEDAVRELKKRQEYYTKTHYGKIWIERVKA